MAPQEDIHPCPFPLELAERIIQFYSYKGDTIIDIFAGTGQALIAAKKLWRKYIGMETEKKYIESAIKKLESVGAQKVLFSRED